MLASFSDCPSSATLSLEGLNHFTDERRGRADTARTKPLTSYLFFKYLLFSDHCVRGNAISTSDKLTHLLLPIHLRNTYYYYNLRLTGEVREEQRY